MAKRRLIDLVVHRQVCEDRDRAGRLIMAGEVLVNGQPLRRPSILIDPEVHITLRGTPRDVSRAGQKLAYALDTWHVTVHDRVVADVGTATGGFTECLLRRGARRVYAVEVGKGQLHWTLRRDPRVVALEGTNILYVSALPEPVHLAVIDTGWTPLRRVLPRVRGLLGAGGEVIALLKPNYEAQDPSALVGGVLRDARHQQEIVQGFVAWAAEHGWTVDHVDQSPITGDKGNVEWLIHLSPPAPEGVG